METGNTLSGRLEVFINGEWGTVCDDDWGINDAHVACRELGYSYAQSYQCCASYGRGSGQIWLDNVGCSGRENSLLNCSHNGIGVLRSCSHSEDVGVVCYQTSATGTLHKCDEFNSLQYIYTYVFANIDFATDKLRLVGGVETSNTLSGRVEVLINGEWGTVCDDGWDISDAHVACRELGYSYALSYQCCDQYGRGSGQIWLDNVGCSGEEDSLLNCSHHGIGVLRSCSHWEDVGVVCYRPGTCTVYMQYMLLTVYK